ncbi:MAG: hypothetical protein M1835_002555 [Candelina submexicana]|nr:MAG: hypothetical protein M1835_002555 [Candelina submexicana]
MDHTWGDQQLWASHETVQGLPHNLLYIIRKGSNPQYLDALAAAALYPDLTDKLFSFYEPVFTDFCARWITSPQLSIKHLASFSAFARVLPFAPHLLAYADELVLRPQDSPLRLLSSQHDSKPEILSDPELQEFLLATFRLLVFQNGIFASPISMSKLQPLLRHASRPIRYLTIRVICLYMHAADAAVQDMMQRYLGTKAIEGNWEGRKIDFAFLSLWEEKRNGDLALELQKGRRARQAASYDGNPNKRILPDELSHMTADLCGVQLPRPRSPGPETSPLILTRTVTQNMHSLARALLKSDPILLTGVIGSGKSSLVRHAAHTLNVATSMLTLHLNEQTDAKLLIGMYTTTSIPGSFTWRPGVLTTAVKEGRWVLIEDLDRAPTEVISVILSLIERGELLLSNRGETIRAAQGFRILATIRTSINSRGEEVTPGSRILGNRLWRRISILMPHVDEFRYIISKSLPLLHGFEPIIMDVYQNICKLYQDSSITTQGRPLSPRDLLKWCRRLHELLLSWGAKRGDEALPEAANDDIFMEAADTFAGSMQSTSARIAVISCIAEHMVVAPQRVQYFLRAHIPKYNNTDKVLRVGRAKLLKPRTHVTANKQATSASRRPFAPSAHTLRLMEQVGVAVQMAEPVLLVGETGTGKTTVIQELANSLGVKLTAVNLSQQSEAGDLLGGFKPVSTRSIAIPMKEEFDDLFGSTFAPMKNQSYLIKLNKCIAKGRWSLVSKFWKEAVRMSEGLYGSLAPSSTASPGSNEEQPKKRRKLDSPRQQELRGRWQNFAQDLRTFDLQLSNGSKGFAFEFIEGNIIKAVRNGGWVLLDEINLATPETLESIADLLHNGPGGLPSILLSETGDIERIEAHPDFRVFGAMNPATDVGKKDLSLGIRSRFTEIYVESPDKDLADLLTIVKAYLGSFCSADERAAEDISRLYLEVKRLASKNDLVDSAEQRPHFSLRTLTRTLSYAMEIAPMYGLRRAVYEGFSMSFLASLDKESEHLIVPLIDKYLLGKLRDARSLLVQTPRPPDDGNAYISFRHYWLPRGPLEVEAQPHYIITPFIERNMLNLVRATSTRQFPVLVQGPTSSGKTSMIEYLAKITGNKFIRINNHEHTDLQEYLGSYVSSTDGQLQFQEGILVQALREGHWVVLDELNLAPTDVLEALNRLLDDNRELLIPETQEIVRPHPKFMLFATQNPPGLYGGRKVLSRALRNRFLELHFDDIPEDELETILRERSQIAPSFCTKIVAVYKRLSLLRQTNRLFEQKTSFATLRDLFRWASRNADDRNQLALNGYMLLAERVRNVEERLAVKGTIEEVMKISIDENVVYDMSRSPEARLFDQTHAAQGAVWTKAMTRLYILLSHALRNNEPVLLVGETGCGKTTVCQMLAQALGKSLYTVNAHQNTETGDLIGAQRPLRNRPATEKQLSEDLQALFMDNDELAGPLENSLESLTAAYEQLEQSSISSSSPELMKRIVYNKARLHSLFEWSDGSLVHAMRSGQHFLLDEISLTDDSVLERLNSVLEPQRTLLLAEKGLQDSLVIGSEGFQFLATMNPGGDYGKRELSPALRNRFTEIWVPPLSDTEDVLQIVRAKLSSPLSRFGEVIVGFAKWFGATYKISASSSISIRDVLAWVEFINMCQNAEPYFSIVQGAAMVFIDTLGANPAAMLATSQDGVREQRLSCLAKLGELLDRDVSALYFMDIEITNKGELFTIGTYSISRISSSADNIDFNLNAPTTKINAMRVVRALQLQKPILLEGNPGVGKTTLIAALAETVGKPLVRVNLSEQTDLMDLFGSDVPVKGAQAGHFAWRDAPFLQAMQRGDWVLLDEMNLASQAVLEGLNACLDHRGEVYISELDHTFKRHPNFVVFAAQNPHHQGGGRKGLPASFVNRFTVVYADTFSSEDLMQICERRFPKLTRQDLSKPIQFVATLEEQVNRQRQFGALGGPWEFNLRDTVRWLDLLTSQNLLLPAGRTVDFLDLLFKQRFRTTDDRSELERIFSDIFGQRPQQRSFFHNLGRHHYQVGLGVLQRHISTQPKVELLPHVPTDRLPALESLMICIQQGWPTILVGSSGSGKTALVKHAAAMTGTSLIEFTLNPDIDTMDLVGGYEQVDPQRQSALFLKSLDTHLRNQILKLLIAEEASSILFMLMELVQEGLNRQDLQHDKNTLQNIRSCLLNLSSNAGLAELLYYYKCKCDDILQNMDAVQQARFEWVDGILIQALERGNWLILDNANLCSPSVLDRLNSLLEPNGFLSINEHPGPDGSAKLVRPHTRFRLFLTMDPRHGELSRAMRNRAVEIYLPRPDILSAINGSESLQSFTYESFAYRYRLLGEIMKRIPDSAIGPALMEVGLEQVSLEDMNLLSRWNNQFAVGLLDVSEGDQPLISSVVERYLAFPRSFDDLTSEIMKFHNEVSTKCRLGENHKTMQSPPHHPLTNILLLSYHQKLSSNTNPYWLATLRDLALGVVSMNQMLATPQQRSERVPVSEMSRLERSFASYRIQRLMKDLTMPISPFLTNYTQTIAHWVHENLLFPIKSESALDFLKALVPYWHDLFKLVSSDSYEDGTFQVFLSLGRGMLSDVSGFPNSVQILANELSCQLNEFKARWQLTTGLSMDILWETLRPKTSSTLEKLHTVLRLEKLADDFDALIWRACPHLVNFSSIRQSISDAIRILILGDDGGAVLAEILKSSITSLNAKADDDSLVASPYFQTEFEGLSQYYALHTQSNGNTLVYSEADPRIALLAKRPTRLAICDDSNPAGLFSRLPLFTGDFPVRFTKPPIALHGILITAILYKNTRIHDVTLRQIGLLQDEVKVLSSSVALSTCNLGVDQLQSLNSALELLINEIFKAHAPFLSEERQESLETSLGSIGELLSCTSSTTLDQFVSCFLNDVAGPKDRHFYRIAQDYLLPSLFYLNRCENDRLDRYTNASKAWVHFAVGSVLLYVPDKAFDPALKPFVQRQRHAWRKLELETKLKALRQAEKTLTGQDTNIRCVLIEQELQKLGESPAVPAIARPLVSELSQLHGEFSNVRESVISRRPELSILPALLEGDVSASLEAFYLRKDIAQIIKRLSENYRGYDDLTAPVIGMLRSLDMGLELATMGSSLVSPSTKEPHALMERTPFLGGSSRSLMSNPSLWPPLNSENQSGFRVHHLKVMAISASIYELSQMQQSRRQQLIEVFHSFYSDWKLQLDQDRKKVTAMSSLYHYKGEENDMNDANEENFRDLFPDYDAEHSKSATSLVSEDPKKLAADLANLHEDIFTSQHSPSVKLLALLQDSVAQLGSLSTRKGTIYDHHSVDNQISGLIVSLHGISHSLQSTDISGEEYNFYRDANLYEAKKLLYLVHKIISRFKQLRKAWPEHAALQDVLTTCHELLAFRFVEPIAKFLTKTEKLHGYIHEWQLVASREYSAVTLFDELTALLVSWRRLELATWARLFDFETDECEKDAKSWWFLAYEVIIDIPMSLTGEQEVLDRHARELLLTLETFFSTTPMGQFSQRLKLVRQFEKHVALLAMEIKPMKAIWRALQNFINYYSRFEQSIRETIARGRKSLEENMREVVLLASWKDININALRESAKRSHHKLFKLVRKYRALLAQPVDLPKQRLPEHEKVTHLSASSMHKSEWFNVDEKALEVCQEYVPDWATKAPRFTNVGATAAAMRRMSEVPVSAVDGAGYCGAFFSNLIASMDDLRKQTPSALTKENKDMLGHLKTRKRKLLADTLKDLRHLGIKSNLSSEAWAKQASLSVVLAGTLTFERKQLTKELSHAEFFFHKSLELIPAVQKSIREHSDDLTNSEIVRCTGYAGGLISLNLKQRAVVSESLTDLTSLKAVTKTMQNLWVPEEYSVLQEDRLFAFPETDFRDTVVWLPHILQTGVSIIESHATLSEINSLEVVQALLVWKDRVTSLVVRWNELPDMPQGLSTTVHTELSRDCRACLEELQAELVLLKAKWPLVDFALKQILLWTYVKPVTSGESTANGHHAIHISDLNNLVFKACDSILAGMQQVKEASLALPSSTEDAGWLIRQDGSLAAVIRAFHMPSIVALLEASMSQIRHMQTPEDGGIAAGAAIFAVILPIVQQYATNYHEAVDRYCQFHQSICQMTYTLINSYSQIATQGFCSPAETSTSEESQSEKLENGTGLGEGEGAEDISKDVQDDEDLSELAQQPDTKGDKGEVEDQKDAVNVEQDEMEGELDDMSTKSADDDGESGGEEVKDDIDEEAGDVDDLDPTAVDEKLWDGSGEKVEKDQHGDQSKGTKQNDEQAASKENGRVDEVQKGNEDEELEEQGTQENEEIGQQEPEKTDPHLQEGEKLDLPDEIDIDGDRQSDEELSLDDSEMDELSDVDEGELAQEQADTEEINYEKGQLAEEDLHDDIRMDIDDPNLDAEAEERTGSKTEDAAEGAEDGSEDAVEDDHKGLTQDSGDNAAVDIDAAAPSDAQGVGDDQDQQDSNEQKSSSNAKRSDGVHGDSSNTDPQQAAAQERQLGQIGQRPEAGQSPDDQLKDSPESQALKKLGDALETWHRQQREIRNPSERDRRTPSQSNDVDFQNKDFEHLPDGDAQPETQALGAATEDQAHTLDESKAVESEGSHLPENFLPDEKEQSEEQKHDTSATALETKFGQEDDDNQQSQPGAFIRKDDTQNTRTQSSGLEVKDDEEDVEEVDSYLSTMQLDASNTSHALSQDEARHLWIHLENKTRSLSLSLTEQLRLILAPTVATKMRGDFRTGKRLNIKRIIPYIASQYKRDKIWMRRSVPSKRNYQIMIAVDDSKSMGESGSGDLAFETLALVAKSLSILEVGEICVVGFGDNVKVAHAFDTPFTSEAGGHVFQQFTFQQTQTDVRKLVTESISLFRSAREKSLSSNTDLWRLELIISDGVCQDHDTIRRLVRQAQEERIMIVFVIVDALRKGESIMDMKEARFEPDENGDTKLRMKRYLDGFPFSYYLVVKDVRELPNVLAQALRQWFAEVVDAGG